VSDQSAEMVANPLDALVADTSSTEAEAVQPDGATGPTGTGAEGQGSPDASTTPSAVQPEGQGLPDAETGLYDLSTVPEEYRSHVERIAKDIDRNVNAKLQQAAEYRQQWEPFGELGLQDIGHEGLGALLQFAQDVSDPETARDAFLALAEAAGVDLGAAQAGDDSEGEEPDAVEALRAEIAEIKAAEAQRQEQAEIATLRTQAEQAYRAEFAEVEQQLGRPFSTKAGPNGEPSERDQLIQLAKRFQLDHDEPIKAAHQWMQQIRGQGQAELVNGQPTPPAAAERGGRASSPVKPVDDWDEALRLHKERNASAHA